MSDRVVTMQAEASPAHGDDWAPKRRLIESRQVQIGLVILAIVLMVVIWELVIVGFKIKEFTLPNPRSVAAEIWSARGVLGPALLVTLKETVVGFAIAAGAGVAVACAIAASKVVERMVYPLLVITNAVPKIALAPIFLAWFGLGSTPRVLIAALLAVFPIVISTAVGLVSVDDGLVLLGRSTNAGRLRIFWMIRLPAALPSIIGGLKIGITMALTGAVVGEFVGGNNGLGYIITNAQGNLQLALAFAAIVVLAVLGIILFYLVELFEKRVIRA